MIWYPYAIQKNLIPPIKIIRGEGEYLIDENGEKYIDAVSSWWTSIHGHNHPQIIEAIKSQLDHLDHVMLAGFTHTPAEVLAGKLVELTENKFTRVYYSDNGSCANEIAIKIAHQFFKNQNLDSKVEILHFSKSYHGDTIGAMSVGGDSYFTGVYREILFPSPEFISPDCYECPYQKNPKTCNLECLENLKEYIDKYHEKVFSIILEPLVQGANGMVMYKEEVLDEIILLCKQKDILVIFDEVFTGFGRTGKFFAYQNLKNTPDIICLAKGLTGGTLPLAATLISDEIYQKFYSEDPIHAFYHGHTMTGNPPACAAALASLNLMENENRLKEVESLNLAFNRLKDDLGIQYNSLIKNIRVLGAIFAFDLLEETQIDRLKNYCLSKKVVIRPLGTAVYLCPPYTITESNLNHIISTLKEGLNLLLE
ncbi:MAG: adenosylmethionine--8-amino-7-oxononanoate transaminase [Leptospiraceae bacterium]|nr:adenosylmethionine--8-amino-7-oxononanoate transaminase [Leptospiraceae bacterium]MCP5512027.1 adenosylmethionine--8-amino-7-oxononanoate transaminase [Leptospiraceae bacterium]